MTCSVCGRGVTQATSRRFWGTCGERKCVRTEAERRRIARMGRGRK